MSILKSILKWLLILIVVLGVSLFVAAKVMSEERPATNATPEADQLAKEMLLAMNKPAWDTLKYLKWEFMGGHKYVWDKQENNVQVSWGENKVLLNLDKVDGLAFQNNVALEGDSKSKMIQSAWSFWCNDSFWMFAPFKAFDRGTSRTIVEQDGQEMLMVSYDTGGVTPGDAYLWQLGDDKIPTGYKMWTFIPLKGMYTSWEKWITLKGGAKVATTHRSDLMTFDMKGVEEANDLSAFGLPENLFAAI